MIIRQRLQRLLIPPLTYQPPRTLRTNEDKPDLDERGQSLEERRDAPAPAGVNLECAEGGPGGDDGAGVPHGIVHRCEGGAVGRIAEESRMIGSERV